MYRSAHSLDEDGPLSASDPALCAEFCRFRFPKERDDALAGSPENCSSSATRAESRASCDLDRQSEESYTGTEEKSYSPSAVRSIIAADYGALKTSRAARRSPIAPDLSRQSARTTRRMIDCTVFYICRRLL